MWLLGMEMYPAAPSLLAFVPEPLLAGVIGGVCFLFVAIILSLVTACVMNNRRGQRRRKKRDGKSSDEDCRVIVMILNMNLDMILNIFVEQRHHYKNFFNLFACF